MGDLRDSFVLWCASKLWCRSLPDHVLLSFAESGYVSVRDGRSWILPQSRTGSQDDAVRRVRNVWYKSKKAANFSVFPLLWLDRTKTSREIVSLYHDQLFAFCSMLNMLFSDPRQVSSFFFAKMRKLSFLLRCRGGRLQSMCQKIRLPDDCTIGFVISKCARLSWQELKALFFELTWRVCLCVRGTPPAFSHKQLVAVFECFPSDRQGLHPLGS